MGLYWATRDFECEYFHIEEVNPKYYKGVGLNQAWETNNSREAEIYVEEETLERAAIKAINLFTGV